MGNIFIIGKTENLLSSEMITQYTQPAEEEVGTFDYDEKLPPLPVPSLEHTIKKYLNSVKPFAENEYEYKKTEKLAYEFLQGEGAVLQEKLLKHAARHKNWGCPWSQLPLIIERLSQNPFYTQPSFKFTLKYAVEDNGQLPITNYQLPIKKLIEKWWEDFAYLTLREPLIPYYNMTGAHPKLPGYQYGPGQQIKIASLYCHQLVLLWRLLREERYKPAVTADKQPLSMNQYRRLFNCSVVPGEVKDTIRAHFKTEREGECSSQAVVICWGHMFVVDSLTPEGHPLSPADWEHQLTEVQQTADSLPPSDLPCLSIDNRTLWAQNRGHLEILDAVNASHLATLDSAMFVVCLDDAAPAAESEIVHTLLCGDYSCRWPDAALNLVFFSNGLSGGLCAHSPFDGIVSGSAMHFTYSALRDWVGRDLNKTSHQQLARPRQLQFITDSYIMSEITRAKHEQAIEKNKVLILQNEFSLFGKKRIQNLRVHPDSFIQMALQLSYYRLHSRFAPCYETATTRTFYNGRTETVRSCSQDCVSWVKSMIDPQTNDSTRAKLLLKAIQKHNDMMSEARSGQGIDRHLMGLYCIAVENNLPPPPLFQDPLFKKSGGGGHFILSTSLLGYSPIGGGVAPMCLQGYGVFYSILPERIIITISVQRDCHETSSLRFFHEISRSVQDMVCLLESQTNAKL